MQNEQVYLHEIFTAFDTYQGGRIITLLYCYTTPPVGGFRIVFLSLYNVFITKSLS